MTLFPFLALSLLTLSAPAPALDGHWVGTWVKRHASVAVEFDFRGATGTFTSVPQAVMDYPLDKVAQKGAQVEFALGDGMKFVGALSGQEFTGTFEDGERGGVFSLQRRPKPALPYVATEVRFGGKDARLTGTLCVPRGKGPFPAVILLHGSGPQSRWGTLRYIADVMARQGIAALCWDQRGSGTSQGQWFRSNYEDLVRDALAGVTLLQGTPGVDRARVGVYGHSQGGALCALLANRSKDVAFVIAGAPIIGKIYEQDLYRVRHILMKRFDAADVEKAMAYYQRWLDIARTGGSHAPLKEETAKAKGEKWFDTVEAPEDSSYIWSYYPPIGNTDTFPLWAQVKAPTLLLYGERDEIEDVAQYALRADTQLRAAQNKDFTILLLPRARHELKVDSEPGAPFAWRRPSPGLYDLIIAWIKLRFGH